MQVVQYSGKTVKVFVEGFNSPSSITTSIPDGGSWSGSINGLDLAVRQGQLSIGGKPYSGPVFSELHVIVKSGSTFETQVARN